MTQNRKYLTDNGAVFRKEGKIYIDQNSGDPDPIGEFQGDTFVVEKTQTPVNGRSQFFEKFFSAGLAKKAVDEILQGSEIKNIRLIGHRENGYTYICEEPLDFWVYRATIRQAGYEEQYHRNVNEWGNEGEGEQSIKYKGESYSPDEFESKEDFILDEAQESLPEPDTEDKPVDEDDFQTEEGQNSIDNFTKKEDEKQDDEG